ncbi:MAG: hypothetical protein MSA07_03825 [Mucispirillum sp.]|nr:hypothetical protein [Mucispirillum sp.]
MKFKAILITILVMIPFASSYAQKAVFSREYPRMMTSVRAMGMGNAFFGVSDDKYAAFYNPAGLAMNKSLWSVDIIPLSIGANSNMVSNMTDITSMFLKGGLNTDTIIKTLDGMIGQYNNISPLGFFPAFTYKNWSFGIFLNSYANILTYNKVMATALAKVHADAGAVLTYAHSFLKDKSLHVGVSLMGFYRMAYTASYTAVDIASIDTNNLLNSMLESTGWGILASVGVMYELPWLRKELNPRVGLSFNDFGYQQMAQSVDKVEPTLNLSLAISPNWEFISSNIVVDFNDLLFMNGSDDSFGKRVNIGAEIGFWNRIFLRTGLHQGYWTAGAGVNIWALRINYAYYTEELGAYAGQYADTRHVIEVVLGWDQLKKQPNNRLID